VANGSGSKRTWPTTRCVSIEIDITIPKDAFDPSALARVIPHDDSLDFTTQSLSGPLRLGGRGHDDYRIVGRSAFHDTDEDKHYHFSVAGYLATKPFAADTDNPTVSEFFGAIVKGISRPAASILVVGRHAYPRTWWRGTGGLDLPVPLSGPTPSAEESTPAQLTGVEVTYDNSDRVLISAVGDADFATLTYFVLPDVASDLFRIAVERSAQLGARFLRSPEP
jgi:hypothetical protein